MLGAAELEVGPWLRRNFRAVDAAADEVAVFAAALRAVRGLRGPLHDRVDSVSKAAPDVWVVRHHRYIEALELRLAHRFVGAFEFAGTRGTSCDVRYA